MCSLVATGLKLVKYHHRMKKGYRRYSNPVVLNLNLLWISVF